MRPAAIVPIRSFDGLTRLAAELDTGERDALMRRLAERTTTAAGDAGAAVTVITGDDAVHIWADERGYAVIDEQAGRRKALAVDPRRGRRGPSAVLLER